MKQCASWQACGRAEPVGGSVSVELKEGQRWRTWAKG